MATRRIAALACLCLCLVPAFAQVKPPESTTKVKKVLLYNKIGGWVHVDGSADVKAVMTRLASAKGFELTQLAGDSGITLEYLKQFQVIIWNNNTNGSASVPSTVARQAVLDYLDQGGGWLLIHGAADHADSWAGLRNVLGTKFAGHAQQGPAEMAMDADALAHKELKWMLDGFPSILKITDSWDGYQNTVRPLSGVTVIATARPITGYPQVLVPIRDGSGDQVYGWAREVGKGRLIFNPVGHGQNQLFAQQDSIVPKLYWQNIRYAAGDFQNGCTLPWDPAFDLSARVLDSAACSGNTGFRHPGASRSGLRVTRGGPPIRLDFIPSGPFTARLRDIRGAIAWESVLPAGAGDIALPSALGSGVFLLEVSDRRHSCQRRLLLP